MKPVQIDEFNKQQMEDFINQFDVILTDCDGVLFIHSNVFKDSDSTLNLLIKRGKQVICITNNNQTTRQELYEKLQKLNFNVKFDDLFTSPYACAKYLNSINLKKKLIYVIGSENIAKEFDAFGLNYFGIGADEIGSNSETSIGQIREYMQEKYKLEENVGAVVVSLDAYFSLPKIVKAINYLKDPDVIFIATNMDDNIKYPEITFPDAGTFVNCIATGSNRVPIVAGKSKILFDQLDLKVDKDKILMIGDRHDLDVVFGTENGLKTLLVETGMSKMQDVDDAIARDDLKMVPDYIASSLGKIYEIINE